MLELPLLLTLLAPAAAGDVHLDKQRGFCIEVPEGWTTEEREGSSERGYSLTLRAPAKGVAIAVQIGELRAGDGLEQIFQRDLEKSRSGERYWDLEESTLEIAGRDAPTLKVSYRAASGEYRIHRSHLVERGSSWVIQGNALLDEFADHLEELDRVRASFAFVELSEQGRATRRLAELAGLCGSELRWANDWAEAAERARREEKPVLVVAWLLATFTRANDARHGILMDRELIALVNERFVPLWYERGMKGAFAEKYGFSRSAFGKALIAMTPDGDTLFETHELGDASVAHEFLRRGLADHPEFAGAPPAAGLSPLEQAERQLERGELEAALEALEGNASAPAHQVRARILVLQRRGEEALAALRAARAAGANEAAMLTEEAAILLRLGRDAEARAALERVHADFAGAGEEPEAQYLSSLLERRRGDRSAAERRWQVLALEHPENRFAWLAAQALRMSSPESAYPPDLGWPEEAAVAEVVAHRRSAPLPPERVGEATEDALAWLLAAQRPDGSWVSPTEVGSPEGWGPEPFVDSIAALGGSALLTQGCVAEARETLGFVLASVASRKQTPPLTWVMDYTTWSDSCMLTFLADARESGIGEREALAAAAASLVDDLAARQQSGGGWTYLVTDDTGSGAPPAHSMSFVTAAVVLALDRAREAGFEVPPELIERGVACLERMRNEDHTFEYRLVHANEDAPRSTELPGAVGRGPLCELALRSEGQSSPERLHRSLELFLDHAELYTAEAGKALAHAGPYIIGCHYLLFDLAHAARAQTLLPPDPGTTLRLREAILKSRLSDGSFTDNPVVGRSYATATALLALAYLEQTEEK